MTLAEFLERPPAFAYFEAYRVLGNYEDAREAVAEAVALAWQHAGGYRGDASLETWFVHIVRNCALMELRRRRRMQDWLIEPRRPANEPTPQSAVLADERERRVARAVRNLPPPYRAAVEYVYYDDVSHKAAAQRLGISYSACRSRIDRARRMLAERMRAA